VTCAVYARKHGLLEEVEKDGNNSRELQNVKRRCFVWSTSLVSRPLAMHQGTSSAIVSLAITMRQCNLT
jgi:hypothetical protein